MGASSGLRERMRAAAARERELRASPTFQRLQVGAPRVARALEELAAQGAQDEADAVLALVRASGPEGPRQGELEGALRQARRGLVELQVPLGFAYPQESAPAKALRWADELLGPRRLDEED